MQTYSRGKHAAGHLRCLDHLHYRAGGGRLEELERKNDFDIPRTGRPALAVEAVSEVEKGDLVPSAASRASSGSPEVACHVTRLAL